MAINVSVQYNGGLLPDIILLTPCYYHPGTRLNTMKRFCLCSLLYHLIVSTFFPLTGGCSEGLDFSLDINRATVIIGFVNAKLFIVLSFSNFHQKKLVCIYDNTYPALVQ